MAALPSIGRELGASTTSLAWAMNAFMPGMSRPLVAMERLGDILGRRKILLIGLVLFGLASVICGVAQNEWQLITGRALQGIASAMFYGLGLSILSNAFPPSERAMAIGIFGAVGASDRRSDRWSEACSPWRPPGADCSSSTRRS